MTLTKGKGGSRTGIIELINIYISSFYYCQVVNKYEFSLLEASCSRHCFSVNDIWHLARRSKGGSA